MEFLRADEAIRSDMGLDGKDWHGVIEIIRSVWDYSPSKELGTREEA